MIEESFALFLNEFGEKFSYCLLRNYEDLPPQDGDIDMLIRRSDLAGALDFFKEYSSKNNCSLAGLRNDASQIKFTLERNAKRPVKFHIQSSFRLFGLLQVCNTEDILGRRISLDGCFIPSEEYEAVLLLLHVNARTPRYLISSPPVKLRHRRKLESLLRDHRGKIYELLTLILSRTLAEKISGYLDKSEDFRLKNLKYEILLGILRRR